MAEINKTAPSSESTTAHPSTSDSQQAFHPEQEKEASIRNPPASPGDESSEDEYPRGLRLFLLVGSVMLTVFLIALDQTIVGTAIPKITDEFHGIEQVSWYGAAYFMCLGGFQSSWGKAYKYFSLKPAFIVSVVLFEIGSLICGVAPNSNALIVGRAISGVGGAGIATGGTTIIAFCAPPRKRPTLMGLLGVTYAVAAVAGPLLGGVFSDRVTWRWCFYINLPIGAVAVAVIWIYFHLPSAAKPAKATWKEKVLQLDPVGIVLAMACIICYILALQYAGVTYAWNSSVVVGLLVGFVAMGITLIVWSIFQGEYAMLVPRLLRKRALWTASVFQFFYAGSYFLLLYYLPVYFQSVGGATPIQSGVNNLPMVIAVGLFVLAGGITVTATGFATPFMALSAALATVASGLFYSMDIDTAPAKWIGYQILSGAAIAFSYMNCLNIAHANVEAEDISAVTAILQFFQTIGGAFSLSAAQSAFVNRMVATVVITAPSVNPALLVSTGAAELRAVFSADELPGILLAYLTGIKAAFAVGIAMFGIATITSVILPWKRLHSKEGGEAAFAA